jgi:uncharacterized protein YdeI (YjbR/CyaY-like superfamily)
MVKTENFQQVEVSSTNELRQWLLTNHTQKESIWLVTYKKEVADKYVSIQEVLDDLLCFGWIDGLRRRLDDTKTMQLISSHKVQHWTKTYKHRDAKLLKEGKAEQAGKDSIALSKKNGLWDFIDDVDKLIKPEDFLKCLQKHPPALECWDNFGNASKRFMLRHIKIAKNESTRLKCIEEITHLVQKGEKLKGS